MEVCRLEASNRNLLYTPLDVVGSGNPRRVHVRFAEPGGTYPHDPGRGAGEGDDEEIPQRDVQGPLPMNRTTLGLALTLFWAAFRLPGPPARGRRMGLTLRWQDLEWLDHAVLPGGEGKSQWTIEDGAICGSGAASMLFSPEGDYQNFRFKAEVRINDKGNSGLYFRTSPQAQLQPTDTSARSTALMPTRSVPARSTECVHVYKQLVPPDRMVHLRGRGHRRVWRGRARFRGSRSPLMTTNSIRVPRLRTNFQGRTLRIPAA